MFKNLEFHRKNFKSIEALKKEEFLQRILFLLKFHVKLYEIKYKVKENEELCRS